MTRPIESTETSRRPGTPSSHRLYSASSPARPIAEPGEHVAVDGDRPGRPVGYERPPHRVDDQAARRLDRDLADGVLVRRRLVVRRARDLDVPKPSEKGREQRQHHDLHDDEAK